MDLANRMGVGDPRVLSLILCDHAVTDRNGRHSAIATFVAIRPEPGMDYPMVLRSFGVHVAILRGELEQEDFFLTMAGPDNTELFSERYAINVTGWHKCGMHQDSITIHNAVFEKPGVYKVVLGAGTDKAMAIAPIVAQPPLRAA